MNIVMKLRIPSNKRDIGKHRFIKQDAEKSYYVYYRYYDALILELDANEVAEIISKRHSKQHRSFDMKVNKTMLEFENNNDK